MKKVALPISLLALSLAALAASSYNTSTVRTSGQSASFYFGGDPSTFQGATVLFINCFTGQAQLVTGYEELGGQLASESFPITCDEVVFDSWVLTSAPQTENLTLTGTDVNGNPISKNVTLTVNSASWKYAGYRGSKSTGEASISY